MIGKLPYLSTLVLLPMLVQASGYELIYKEEEPGIDPYLSRVVVSDRYLRIDEPGDDSGFVLYDDDAGKVFSVNHANRTIMVILSGQVDVPELSDRLVTEDRAMKGAPKIDGKQVNDYRVELRDEAISETCTHIQYVPGLLPGVGAMMSSYVAAMVANQVRTLEATPAELQTPCMLSDQVYFDGSIYSKGVPIMEWRSNGKMRVLQSYRESEPGAASFELPDGYREFSLN